MLRNGGLREARTKRAPGRRGWGVSARPASTGGTTTAPNSSPQQITVTSTLHGRFALFRSR